MRRDQETIKMTEVWNNVTVYGPASEVERFRKNCVKPAEDDYRNHQSGWDGCECILSLPSLGNSEGEGVSFETREECVSNFQQFTSDSRTEYSFSFDTGYGFPEGYFEELASRFPRLAFECDCIESLDEFMGFGWFNAPPGGENFRQDYDVPRGYWDTGGSRKRSPEAEMAHRRRIDDFLDKIDDA
ncbi:hypothetical protein A3711_07235 [Erythrobacter sp. HI00D59]|nr:hypothetical protein A3711_07235 [Erythrobacter sp. HI00D59]